jgi:hypothetical protein
LALRNEELADAAKALGCGREEQTIRSRIWTTAFGALALGVIFVLPSDLARAYGLDYMRIRKPHRHTGYYLHL